MSPLVHSTCSLTHLMPCGAVCADSQSDPSMSSRDAYTVAADRSIDRHGMPDEYVTLVRHQPLSYGNQSSTLASSSSTPSRSLGGHRRSSPKEQRAVLAGRTLRVGGNELPPYWE